MGRVEARGVVARMHDVHSSRDNAFEMLEGQAMHAVFISVEADRSIALGVAIVRPEPTPGTASGSMKEHFLNGLVPRVSLPRIEHL